MPLASKKQLRYLFAAQARGDVPKGTAEKFVKETGKKAMAKLPEKAPKRRLDPLVSLKRAKKAASK